MRILKIFILFIFLASSAWAVDWTLDGDCLHAWKFDDEYQVINPTGQTALDLCGTFNGDLSELPPDWGNGKFFGGIDSTGDMIRFGDTPALDGSTDFTISIWIKNAVDLSGDQEDNYWRKDNAFSFQDAVDRQRVIQYTTSRTDLVFADDDYPTDYLIAEDNEWHMYTYTYDGAGGGMYRDCIQVNGTLADVGGINNSTEDLVFGRKPPELSGPSGSFTGSIDDFIIIDRVIDSAECTDLMTNGIDGNAGLLPRMTVIQGGSGGITLHNVTINGGGGF